MATQVQVLNISYQHLRWVSVKQAFHLLYLEKAVAATDKVAVVLRSVKRRWVVPAVIKLKQYIKPRFDVPWSRQGLFERDNYTCQYCGCKLNRKSATVDHIIPRVQGGKSEWTNTVTACFRCNNHKGDKTPQQANMPLLRQPKVPRYNQ